MIPTHAITTLNRLDSWYTSYIRHSETSWHNDKWPCVQGRHISVLPLRPAPATTRPFMMISSESFWALFTLGVPFLANVAHFYCDSRLEHSLVSFRFKKIVNTLLRKIVYLTDYIFSFKFSQILPPPRQDTEKGRKSCMHLLHREYRKGNKNKINKFKKPRLKLYTKN